MLTDAQRAEGWREHDGGECPVPPENPVRIMLRDGSTPKWPRAGSVIWKYGTPIWEAGGIPLPKGAEVIAYREEPRA